jgi:DNA-directed RNA polymerase III subunit RPC6
MLQGANGKLLFRANADPSGAEVSGMSGDERIIYGLIQQSSSQGVWIKDLKYKSNLHQNVIAKIVKTLEARKLVKAVKSVKHATRKVYMLYDVQPSRDVTGGPWFTDSELDSDFIESLTNLIYRYILSRSFPSSSSSVSNSSAAMTATDPLYSLDYVGYPNVLNVLKFIKEAKITSTELLLEDINCLLDVLIYDGKIERVVNVGAGNAIMYKATKPKKELNDVISSVPCGNCPVRISINTACI